jgi:hypothetical protein
VPFHLIKIDGDSRVIQAPTGQAQLSQADERTVRFESRAPFAALAVTFLGLLVRLWAAHGIFLNPDEALHFRLANQPSLLLAYKASLTASHPPLLTIVLYYWRTVGTSELWLRMPSVIASVVFCWMFYKWLSRAVGPIAGVIGLIFVAFLPPIVLLSVEIRQYPLMLAFLASALYFLDDAFAKNSAAKMAAFTLFLYGAMFSHYSAFFFAAALGIYALIRFFFHRSLRLLSVWAAGQLGGAALAIFFYKVHISKLGLGHSRTVLQGWMSDVYLERSYFNSSRDNPVIFLLGHTFGVFQYFFGQLAIGDVMGLLFVIGVVFLLRGKGLSENPGASLRLGVFLLLPFAIAGAVSLAHVYPFGGTRHVSFLIIPAFAGVSLAIVRLAKQNIDRSIGIAALILATCIVFGKTRPPRMDRPDQSHANMAAAIQFIHQNVDRSDIIFTAYQTDLILGHYLCQQKSITIDLSLDDYEQFTCDGYRVVSDDYKTEWMFWASNFPKRWQQLIEAYNLKLGDTVWVCQAGWDVGLPEDLRKNYAEFRNLQFESFGANIQIFKLTVGESMPAVASTSLNHFPAAPLNPSARRVSSSGTLRPSFLVTTPKLPE